MHALDTFKLQDIDFVSSQNGEYPLDIMDMDMKTENLTSEMYFSNILGRGSAGHCNILLPPAGCLSPPRRLPSGLRRMFFCSQVL